MNTVKENYVSPQVEAMELKIEGSVLTISELTDYTDGGEL